MMTGEYRRIEPNMLMMMVMVMFSHGRGEFVGSQEKILIKRSCLIWATSLDCGCGLKWFGIGLLSFYMGPGYVPSLGYQTSLLYMLVEWSLMFRGVTQRTYSNVSNKGIVSRILVRCFRTWRWVQIFYLILGGERKKIYQSVICHHYPSFTSLVCVKIRDPGFWHMHSWVTGVFEGFIPATFALRLCDSVVLTRCVLKWLKQTEKTE